MININNKQWNELCFEDINEFLNSNEKENFFFEFKSDDVSNEQVIREISAFANTYGGYVFLGINDNKSIEGCVNWTEDRIHNVIHDSLTPIPNFDVKQFIKGNKTIYVVKIEEGTMPPYITNKGQILGRVSSGSYVINQSSQLIQLYRKYENGISVVKNKIEIPAIDFGDHLPSNFCGYIDVGFSVVMSNDRQRRKNFLNMDLLPIIEYLKNTNIDYSISNVGLSYLISVGDMALNDPYGNSLLLDAGVGHFIEIMADGSVKYRIMLFAEENTSKVDITHLAIIKNIFLEIYKKFFINGYSNMFISAHKYEQLTVIKQFTPFYKLGPNDTEENIEEAKEFENLQQEKYGENIIISGNRIPINDYNVIDKRWIESLGIEYNSENLINELFHSEYFNLGFFEYPNFNCEDSDDK